MFGFFTWIRGKTRTAVLAGIGDALAELDPRDDAEAVVAGLKAHLAVQLPSPVAAEPPGLDLLAEAAAAGIDPREPAGNRTGAAKPRGRKKAV
jgi:hypothetical protein